MARFKNMLELCQENLPILQFLKLKETEEIIKEARQEGCFLEWEEAEYLAKRRIAHEVLMTTSDFDKSKMH